MGNSLARHAPRKVGAHLPQSYGEGNAIVGWDLDNKKAILKDGRVIQYDACVSTMPLDVTLRMAGKVSFICTKSTCCACTYVLSLRPYSARIWRSELACIYACIERAW